MYRTKKGSLIVCGDRDSHSSRVCGCGHVVKGDVGLGLHLGKSTKPECGKNFGREHNCSRCYAGFYNVDELEKHMLDKSHHS